MSKKPVAETFATIDEDGNRVILERVRYFQTLPRPDGALAEVEHRSEYRVDGEAVASVDEDPLFRYKVAKTGKKLRLP